MIQQIINDAKAMEAEVIRSEEDAQKARIRSTSFHLGAIPLRLKKLLRIKYCVSIYTIFMFRGVA